jgi:hypothetical protein
MSRHAVEAGALEPAVGQVRPGQVDAGGELRVTQVGAAEIRPPPQGVLGSEDLPPQILAPKV